MSFLYPRTISVRRQKIAPSASFGTEAFGGVGPANESIIYSGIPASIQDDRLGRFTPSNLPSSSGLPILRILIPPGAVPLSLSTNDQGAIRKNDIIVDDTGLRYQVHTPAWTSLGWNLKCELMAM